MNNFFMCTSNFKHYIALIFKKFSPLLAILLIILVVQWFYSGRNINYCEKPYQDRDQRISGYRIVMFSTNSCHYCYKAREYLSRQGVTFCEYDVSEAGENRQAFYSLTGSAVPLIQVGDVIIHGFDKAALQELLQL